MTLTTAELIKTIDQLKEYVSIAEKRNALINNERPFSAEKILDLYRVNNEANASMKKILDHLIEVLEEEERYWNQQADLQKESEVENAE